MTHLFLKSFRALNYLHGNYNEIFKKPSHAGNVFKVMIDLFKVLIDLWCLSRILLISQKIRHVVQV